MLLLGNLPTRVDIGGTKVSINPGHRAGVEFTSVLENCSVSDEVKLTAALNIYYGAKDVKRCDNAALIKAALDFYLYSPAAHYGRTKAALAKGAARRKPKQLISYAKDDALIYAAFMQVYGIDLAVTDIHWHKFRALIEGLTSNTQLVKVMRYRGAKLGDLTAEERKHYKEMQEYYSLEQISDDEAERLTALEEKLMNMG